MQPMGIHMVQAVVWYIYQVQKRKIWLRNGTVSVHMFEMFSLGPAILSFCIFTPFLFKSRLIAISIKTKRKKTSVAFCLWIIYLCFGQSILCKQFDVFSFGNVVLLFVFVNVGIHVLFRNECDIEKGRWFGICIYY